MILSECLRASSYLVARSEPPHPPSPPMRLVPRSSVQLLTLHGWVLSQAGRGWWVPRVLVRLLPAVLLFAVVGLGPMTMRAANSCGPLGWELAEVASMDLELGVSTSRTGQKSALRFSSCESVWTTLQHLR